MRRLLVAVAVITAMMVAGCEATEGTPSATPGDTPNGIGTMTPEPNGFPGTPTPGTMTPTPINGGGDGGPTGDLPDDGTPIPSGTATPVGPTGQITFPEATVQAISPPQPVSGMPPEVEESLEQWPLPQRDYEGTRATTDSEIDSSTIDQLGLAWSFEVPGRGAFGALATNPIVLNDTVYIQDLGSNIFAIDLESGDVLWESIQESPSIGPNGVAVGWGKVFAATTPKEFSALDAETGEVLWTADLDLAESEGIDIQPIVYDDLVFMSTVPGSSITDFYAGNASGKVYALDQETGEVAWQFDTVLSEDLWGNPEVNSGGGAWFPASIDTERGMTYWGVGNPAPYPGTEDWPNGTSRPGPNLYTNSVIALDHETGELEWYQQSNPHDIFDLDFQNTPILTQAEVSGREHDLAIGSGKDGRVMAIDRETGSVVWETPVGIHQYDQLSAIPEGETLDVWPGVYGGVETPMAYAGGFLYVPVVNLPTPFTSTGSGETNFAEATGEMVAIDVETGRIAWMQELPQMPLGGATVINDLVVTALYDGTIYAFDRASGELVWEYQMPVGINSQPAVVGDTMLWPAGVQSGDAPPGLYALRIGAEEPWPGVTPEPSPTPTPIPATPTPTPDMTTMTPTPSPTPTPMLGTPTPGMGTPMPGTPTPGTPMPGTPTPTADVSPGVGQLVVQQQGCLACHSTGGATLIGPTFQGLFMSEVPLQSGGTVVADEEYLRESIVDPNAQIHEGFPPGVMPQNYGEELTEQEIDSIIAYLESL